jgi:hypothetical protein
MRMDSVYNEGHLMPEAAAGDGGATLVVRVRGGRRKAAGGSEARQLRSEGVVAEIRLLA